MHQHMANPLRCHGFGIAILSKFLMGIVLCQPFITLPRQAQDFDLKSISGPELFNTTGINISNAETTNLTAGPPSDPWVIDVASMETGFPSPGGQITFHNYQKPHSFRDQTLKMLYNCLFRFMIYVSCSLLTKVVLEFRF